MECGKFLVGFRCRLFCVESDCQVEETVIGYNAAGSGNDIALRALFATQKLDVEPEVRLELALSAAAYYNSDTRPPFVCSLERRKRQRNRPMRRHEIPTYRYRHASNLLIIEKYPEWVQLALRCGWTLDIRVTGQAITTIQGIGRTNFHIERELVCESADLYKETRCILVVIREGLSFKVYPDELWDEVVVSFLPQPHTGG